MGERRLTAKQQLFVAHYLDTLNGTEAARRAGYKGSESVLGVAAFDNLRKPKIMAAVAEGMAKLAMPEEEILTRLTAMGRGNLPTRKDDTKDGPIEHFDSLKALELLGKEHALFKERIEHTGSDGGPLEINYVDLTEAQRELVGERAREIIAELSDGSAGSGSDNGADPA